MTGVGVTLVDVQRAVVSSPVGGAHTLVSLTAAVHAVATVLTRPAVTLVYVNITVDPGPGGGALTHVTWQETYCIVYSIIVSFIPSDWVIPEFVSGKDVPKEMVYGHIKIVDK